VVARVVGGSGWRLEKTEQALPLLLLLLLMACRGERKNEVGLCDFGEYELETHLAK